MEAFGKTMLQGVFPVYIWVISATIIVLSNRYISVTRVVGNNAVKVLATLFLLSYSKMLRVATSSLNYIDVDVWPTNSTHHSVRWMQDGNISYFESRHLILMILAALFLIIFLPFSVFLLCIKHVYSLSTISRAFSWIDKLKPVSDAYTGPFKDNARFWTGLLLFARIMLLIVHTVDFDYSPFIFVTTMCLMLCSLIISLNGLYKDHWLNVLECSFLLNMGMIFISHAGESTLWKSIVVHILLSFAFLTFLGIIAYHVHLKCSSYRWLRKLTFWRRNTDFDVRSCEFERMRDYRNIDNMNDNTGPGGADVLEDFQHMAVRVIVRRIIDFPHKS